MRNTLAIFVAIIAAVQAFSTESVNGLLKVTESKTVLDMKDPKWMLDGVLEVEYSYYPGYPVNRTTFPVGQCMRNYFGVKGRFAKMAVTRPDKSNNRMMHMVVQGFEDDRCREEMGKPFDAVLQAGRNMEGTSIRYSERRSPHPMGMTTRLYTSEQECNRGHVDLWNREYHCMDGGLLNPRAKSHFASCQYGYAIEYSQPYCMGESVFHSLNNQSTFLGQCLKKRGMTAKFVCGGEEPQSSMSPTSAPTPAVYTDIPETNVAVYGQASYQSGPVYFRHQWMGGPVSGSGSNGVYFGIVDGPGAEVDVYYHNPSINMDCDPSGSCNHCSGYAMPNASIYCNFGDSFNYYCADGCDILVGVRTDYNMVDFIVDIFKPW